MKELIEHIVRELVEKPEAVKVVHFAVSTVNVLEVHVDEADVGQVVGKDGQTVDAIRTLMVAIAGRRRLGRWQLEIPKTRTASA